MPAVTRLGDRCTGHGCFPPRVSTQGSTDVFVNGIAAHRQGDAWAVHDCETGKPHGGILAQGCATVYVNGLPVGRIDDPIDCGSRVMEGSYNVFAGE